jgi:hypothetical protein
VISGACASQKGLNESLHGLEVVATAGRGAGPAGRGVYEPGHDFCTTAQRLVRLFGVRWTRSVARQWTGHGAPNDRG